MTQTLNYVSCSALEICGTFALLYVVHSNEVFGKWPQRNILILLLLISKLTTILSYHFIHNTFCSVSLRSIHQVMSLGSEFKCWLLFTVDACCVWNVFLTVDFFIYCIYFLIVHIEF